MQKILIITGASKGIGKAIAELFASHDWKIINLARTPYTRTDAVNITCDLTQPATLAAKLQPLLSTLKTPQQICLVHNAAIFFNDSVKHPELNQLNHLINLSLISPTSLNQLLIPHMAPLSSIIYIGSTLSEKAIANAASYVTCKHALIGLMRATCQDLALDGIHTCCVCPGFTYTDMLKNRFKNHDAAALAFLEFAKSKVGAHRLVEAQEIAALVYFSALNPALNSAVLHANLGQLES